MRLGVALAIATLAVAACDHRKHEYSGIGPYQVDKTKLANASGRCEPTDLDDGRKATWCYLQKPVTIATRTADVDLYFLGTEPTAPVIEIQFQVRGCKPDLLSLWVRERFGAPVEERPTWAAWRNSKLFIIAEMSDASRCLLRVLPKSEQAEFDRLRAKALGPAAPTPTP